MADKGELTMQDISREIISRAAQGDLNAFETIYKAYFNIVTNVALRVVNRLEDAEDIAQEVFMNIYHNLKNFRFESSLKTWIYRAAVNTAINHSKKTSRHRDRTVEYTEALNAPNPGEDARQKIDAQSHEKIVQTLLNAVSPEQRACIVLRSIEGLSYQEIAATLNIPINTVRSRIKRARETMLALRKEVISHEM